ncbi:uncharacterized protein [Palaemon carinicauda]|uniref:uncharacterized protein n=1 Tax=Palaemon carinicauda TaxID=392227 RepID=UPI0035B591A3
MGLFRLAPTQLCAHLHLRNSERTSVRTSRAPARSSALELPVKPVRERSPLRTSPLEGAAHQRPQARQRSHKRPCDPSPARKRSPDRQRSQLLDHHRSPKSAKAKSPERYRSTSHVASYRLPTLHPDPERKPSPSHQQSPACQRSPTRHRSPKRYRSPKHPRSPLRSPPRAPTPARQRAPSPARPRALSPTSL